MTQNTKERYTEIHRKAYQNFWRARMTGNPALDTLCGNLLHISPMAPAGSVSSSDGVLLSSTHIQLVLNLQLPYAQEPSLWSIESLLVSSEAEVHASVIRDIAREVYRREDPGSYVYEPDPNLRNHKLWSWALDKINLTGDIGDFKRKQDLFWIHMIVYDLLAYRYSWIRGWSPAWESGTYNPFAFNTSEAAIDHWKAMHARKYELANQLLVWANDLKKKKLTLSSTDPIYLPMEYTPHE